MLLDNYITMVLKTYKIYFMKSIYLLFLFLISVSVFSQNAHKIKKITFYDNRVVLSSQGKTIDEVDLRKINADSVEVLKLNSIISNITPKSISIYKPAAGHLEGLILLDNEEEVGFKLSYGSLLIKQGKRRHYLFKNNEDLNWIKELISKYHKIFEDI